MRLIRTERILRGMAPQGELPSQKGLFAEAAAVAWPSILESFLVSLVGMVDTIMVGTLGAYAIAAVGLTTQPKFIGLAFFLSLNVAVSAIVARRRGENDPDGANRVLKQAILLTLGLTLVISLASVLFAEPIMLFAGAEADTHADASAYFRIIMGGLFFNTVSMVINAAQRGAGNTRIAMRTSIVSNLVNVLFNYLLIGGNLGFPRLGVRGAAIATVIGSFFACLMSILSISHPDGFVHLSRFWHVRFDTATLKSMFTIGSSTLAEQIFMRIGFLIYAIIVAKLGTTAFAAHQIGMNLLSISFSFGDGLSVAAVALAGRSLGEGRPDLAKLYGAVCQRIAVGFSCLIAVVYTSCGRLIFMLFSREEAILHYGVMIMAVTSVITFCQISQVVYSGCLRGGGDTVYTAFVGLVSVTFIRPFSGWLFCYPLGWGLTGAWIGILVDQLARLLLTLFRFKSGKWLVKKI